MRLLVSILVLSITLNHAPTQQTLHVPSQYKTIQLAIWAANDKDTVLVAPGTYKEWDIDFLGKAIVVRSSAGSAYTTISTYPNRLGVLFKSNETKNSILEGFTILNTDTAVYCWNSTPTITRNVFLSSSIACESSSPEITQNTFSGSYVRCMAKSMAKIKHNIFSSPNASWGVCCEASSPIIDSNSFYYRDHCIHANDNSSPVVTTNILSGNVGIYINDHSSAYIDSNFFVLNYDCGVVCYESPNVVLINNRVCENGLSGLYFGRGLYCNNSNLIIMNCAFSHNGKSTCNKGGAVYCDVGSKMIITNTLFWANSAKMGNDVYIGEDTSPSTVTISYSNTKKENIVTSASSTLVWGDGMMYADPQFVDHENHDYHLFADSPCIDKGTAIAPGVPQVDFEGDARFPMGIVDIGADEFHPHLYHTGETSPGKTMHFKIIGTPCLPVILAYSYNPTPLYPPLSIPGVAGTLQLQHPFYLVPIGSIPANGLLTLTLPIPPNHPTQTFSTQALIGLQISNMDIVDVK